MRKLQTNLPPTQPIQDGTGFQKGLNSATNYVKINFLLNANLIQEIRQWLTSQYRGGILHYGNLGEFARQALTAYQNKQIELDWSQRPQGKKSNLSINFYPSIYNFYYTLPHGQRTALIELCLLSYYQFKKEQI